MLNALLIESDPLNRDIIKVGLEQFQVFAVDHAEDAWGVEMAREKNYDLILVSVELKGEHDGLSVIRQIREFETSAEVILLTRGKSSRLLGKEKSASNIFSLITLPISEQSFFKTISRAKDRIQSKASGGRG